MKRIYYLLISFILITICPIFVKGATMSLEGDIVGNTVKYDLYYTGAEEDNTTLNFDVATNTNIKPQITKDSQVSGKCGSDGCYLDLPSSYTAGQKIKIAEVTLTNNYAEEAIINLTVSMGGNILAEQKDIKLSSGQTTTEKPKSNNSNMTDIKLSVGTLDKTFDQNVTSYTVTGIKDTVNSITLTPTCDNCEFTVSCPTGGCSVSNKKRVSLEEGSNNVAINIVSEDKSSNKTYMFNIYRGDIITSSPYLENLIITGLALSPKFDSLNNDYSLTLKEDLEKLDIVATPEDPTADVKIKGNEKLKVGENTITITVTSSDGENKQVYTILVTKEEKETTTKKMIVTKVNKKKNNKLLIIIISLIAILIIVISFILIFKKKKKKNKNGNNKNDKSNNNHNSINDTQEIIKENTDSLNILEDTRREMENEKKTNVDDALDDLMKTKKLELGDLDLYN